MVVIVGLEGIMDNCCSFSGGFSGGDSLFEWPNERSLFFVAAAQAKVRAQTEATHLRYYFHKLKKDVR